MLLDKFLQLMDRAIRIYQIESFSGTVTDAFNMVEQLYEDQQPKEEEV